MKNNFAFDKSLNQPPILENYNLFASDLPLQTAVEANGGAFNNENANHFGEILGRAEAFCISRLAENNCLNFGTLPVGIEARKIIERNGKWKVKKS